MIYMAAFSSILFLLFLSVLGLYRFLLFVVRCFVCVDVRWCWMLDVAVPWLFWDWDCRDLSAFFFIWYDSLDYLWSERERERDCALCNREDWVNSLFRIYFIDVVHYFVPFFFVVPHLWLCARFAAIHCMYSSRKYLLSLNRGLSRISQQRSHLSYFIIL